MKKIIFKKIIMLIIIFIMMFFLVDIIGRRSHSTQGYNYSLSNYWDGSNLTVSPLSPIVFESQYVPYSTIDGNPLAIDENKTYVISTAIDLFNFSIDSMGESKDAYLSLNYILGNNIDYNVASQQGALFRPIGFETTHPFSGTFDGQGFIISNLYFEPIFSSEDYTIIYNDDLLYYSLFSRISSTGIVKNLGLKNTIMIQPINWGIMSYASPLVGLNQGLVDHVFVIDDRSDPGLTVDGDFHIAGIMSVNQGTFSNAFLSAEFVKSEAVTTNITSRTTLTSNSGSITNVYFDDTVYTPLLEPGDLGTALLTEDFQDPAFFGMGWYLNNYYSTTNPQAQLHNTYPILTGIETDITGRFLIQNSLDLLYMPTLLASSSYFRSKTYVLTKDIDMNQVSEGTYDSPATDFSGTFTSDSIVDPGSTTLYSHSESEGAFGFYSIIGFSVSTATIIGTSTSYGLFGTLSGTVENINFVNGKILANDTPSHIAKTRNGLGFITGNLNGGTIHNTHVLGTISLESALEIGKTYIGGLVGYGFGIMTDCTSSGSIDGGIHPYISNSDYSSLGGLVGYSDQLEISQCINGMDIVGISFAATNTSIFSAGGIVGTGITKNLTEVVNQGNIVSHDETGFVNTVYLGGIIGLHTQEMVSVSRANNQGNVTVLVKDAINAKAAGFGNVIGSSNFTFYSLANEGQIGVSYVNGGGAAELSDAVLETIKIEIAGVVITSGTNAYFQGLFNKANLTLDMSACNNFAAVILCNNNYYDNSGTFVYDNISSNYGTSVTIVQAYNYGNVNAITTGNVVWYQMKISGNSLGKNITSEQLRNTGDVSVHFTYPTTKLINSAPTADGITTPYKNLKVMGLLEEVSPSKYASDLYNGGKISVTMQTGLKVKFNLFISGIAFKNANTTLFSTYGIDFSSVDIHPEVQGSISNAVNDGELYVVGEFYGQSQVSGIVSVNSSLISECVNTANIFNQNAVKALTAYADGDTYSKTEFAVETGGVSFLMLSQYAQIRDCANYGTVTSYSTTLSGRVHAGGIAVRNDKYENGTNFPANNATGSHFAKIMFTINYGKVFAWNPIDESAYLIANETNCKAAGIMALGVLSIIDTMNTGSIYSRYLAGGILGFLYFTRFAVSTTDAFLANSINYGDIRRLISTGSGTGCPFSYDSGSQDTIFSSEKVDPTYVPKGVGNEEYGFGAFVGKIHTGSAIGWNFSRSAYSIRNVVFSDFTNFDEITDVIGKAPATAKSDQSLEISTNRYLATVRLSDGSTNPFDRIKSYSLDAVGLTGQSGRDGTTYMGIFNPAYHLITPPDIITFETDSLIADYIQFTPYSKVNSVFATRIGLNIIGEVLGDDVGLFAVSTSDGNFNGEFIPDTIDLSKLNPHLFNEFEEDITDDSWQYVVNCGTETEYYKFNSAMKQLDKSISSTIFDMEFVCDQDSSIVLRDPVLDQRNNIATFFVPSNSDAASGSTTQSVSVYRYIKAAEGVAGSVYVPYSYNSSNGKYVGQYKKNVDGTYSVIGPYDSTGIFNLTFTTGTSNLKIGYLQGGLYTDSNGVPYYLYDYYNEDVRTKLYTRLTATSAAAGYGQYRFVSGDEYAYVGPAEYSETYVRVADTVSIYSDNGKTFSVNLVGNTYQLAKNASLYYFYNNQNNLYGGNEETSIPSVSGIYDEVYDASTNALINTFEDYYGSVRVYSESYVYDPLDESGDPYTFTDYKIRIVRVSAAEFSNLNTLLVNGTNGKPLTIPDLNDVTSTVNVAYKPNGVSGGVVNVTYATTNLANSSELLPVTNFYDSLGVEVDPALYSLTGGTIATAGIFNHITGSWGAGTVSFTLSTVQALHSGNYTIVITLSTSDVYHIHLFKEESPEATVLSLTFNNQQIAIPAIDKTYTSFVPFGIYYSIEDPTTGIVNFNNLDTILNVSYDNIIGSNLPDYLTALSISPYALITSIDFSVTMYDTYRHSYNIVYNIEAENGTLDTFTHYLVENAVGTEVIQAFNDGDLVNTLPYNAVGFNREEAPTMRFDFDFSTIYFGNDSPLAVESSFLGTGTATLGVDYFTSVNNNFGFEAEFTSNTPIGDYQCIMTFSNSKVISSGDVVNWSFTFQTVTITKKLNNNSHLNRINFVSDTTYSGLDTVMDIVEMTDVTYQGYIDNRSSREIILLPNTNINYNDYLNYNCYWVIGQVQKTNLEYFSPDFTLPIGAAIYRIIDETNVADPSLQSTNLNDDFNPNEDLSTFNSIHFRIYAEDYVMLDPNFNTHYTDYYVAVQDITNNILFVVSVVINPDFTFVAFDKLFVTINVDDLEYSTTSASMFAYFYQSLYTGEHIQFKSGMSGVHTVVIDLPPGYDFSLSFTSPDVIVFGHQFLIADTIIPKKYAMTITITVATVNPGWGQRSTFNFEPV